MTVTTTISSTVTPTTGTPTHKINTSMLKTTTKHLLLELQLQLKTCEGTLITFDDIPQQSSTIGAIPNGYKGFHWINAEYLNVSITPIGSIYEQAANSFPFVMRNANGSSIQFGKPTGSYFRMLSFRLTSILPFHHTIYLNAIENGLVTSTILVEPSDMFTDQVNCISSPELNAIRIDVKFDSNYSYLVPNSTHIIIDNLCVSV